MTVVGRYPMEFVARRKLNELKRMGDKRRLVIAHSPEIDSARPFVLHAFPGPGVTDVPVSREDWPLDLGPQDIHGSDEAA